MVDETHVQLTPNGYGAQPYFSSDFLSDTSCPLEQGQTCIAKAFPGIGVLLVPESDDRDYEVSPV